MSRAKSGRVAHHHISSWGRSLSIGLLGLLMAPVVVFAQARVSGTMSATGSPGRGAPTTYTVVLTNTGVGAQEDNAGPEFFNFMNASLAIISASATSGTTTVDTGFNAVSWNGAIPPSGSVTITMTAAVAPAPLHVIFNYGTISFDRDGNGSNEEGVNITTSFTVGPALYFLPEGANGSFFTETLLIANPNSVAAPVTIRLLPDGAAPIVQSRNVPAQSRLTIPLDDILPPGDISLSIEVTSTDSQALAVERTMFWDDDLYGGHTETAITETGRRWYFAEGAQGFFDTFVLVVNPQPTPADVTFTFLRENAPPVTKTIQVAGNARATVPTASIPELANQSFGIIVDATQPVAVERAMYFGVRPADSASPIDRPWRGGHAAAGVLFPDSRWYHAEAATGAYFDTFLLLMNPQPVEASVTIRYLLASGETIDVPKRIPAQSRLTVNIEAEDDPRLQSASMSVVITANAEIVSERTMYWGDATTTPRWIESHNSLGTTEPDPQWIIAEGRCDGTFHTYLLIGNPNNGLVDVTVTYLRESGAPVIKTYRLPPTSRKTVDVNVEVPELAGQRFGASIGAGGPIFVERSMYWDAGGVTWEGGSNALATRRLPLR